MGQEHVVMKVSRFNHVIVSIPVFTGSGPAELRTKSAPESLAENLTLRRHDAQKSTQ